MMRQQAHRYPHALVLLAVLWPLGLQRLARRQLLAAAGHRGRRVRVPTPFRRSCPTWTTSNETPVSASATSPSAT